MGRDGSSLSLGLGRVSSTPYSLQCGVPYGFHLTFCVFIEGILTHGFEIWLLEKVHAIIVLLHRAWFYIKIVLITVPFQWWGKCSRFLLEEFRATSRHRDQSTPLRRVRTDAGFLQKVGPTGGKWLQDLNCTEMTPPQNIHCLRSQSIFL